MKSYQEVIESFIPNYKRSRNKNDFYNHKEWAEFVYEESIKIEMAAFIFGTNYKAMCDDIIAAANK